ncbi:MAG: redoxin domain-containing protein [Halobacteriales archaeon]|nr:redoxin domain-containing protein [Halobacteriales archaeon]
MLTEGAKAPEFTLSGVYQGDRDGYSLGDETEAGNRILLLFYPADFSPVCTAELCAIREAEWFTLSDNLLVWAISGDSTYAHQAFAEEYYINYPLLTDHDGDVSEQYDVLYDEWEGNTRVPKRAVYLIDTDRTIRYAWATEDAYVEPEYPPILEALTELTDIDPTVQEADIGPAVGYDDEGTSAPSPSIDRI